jgi:hypothetical protein
MIFFPVGVCGWSVSVGLHPCLLSPSSSRRSVPASASANLGDLRYLAGTADRGQQPKRLSQKGLLWPLQGLGQAASCVGASRTGLGRIRPDWARQDQTGLD